MQPNPALQPTANPLRGLSATELGRDASGEPGGTWVKMMHDGPIVEEMRAHGREFAARNENDIRRMCETLRELETVSGLHVVRREPKRLERRAGAEAAQTERADFHAMHDSPTLHSEPTTRKPYGRTSGMILPDR